MTWLSDAALERLRDVADWPAPSDDRYDILEPLARGGMGTVYRARDRELDRIVALKVLSATAPVSGDEAAAARLRQEARVLARLEHPGIVPIHDVGLLDDGRLFYVMKLVQGPRLDEHAAQRPLAERLRLFTRICEPVAFAHARGIVHRDLKPENVMVGPFGEVLVLDWGVALVHESPTHESPNHESPLRHESQTPNPESRLIVGTRAYMSPEQADGGEVDERADVYALGGLLHFLLTGAAPDAEPLAGPRPLQAICRKARREAAADRYPDVPALAADVERFLAGEPVSAIPERAIDKAARFARKHRAAIVLIAAYLILRAVIAWLAP